MSTIKELRRHLVEVKAAKDEIGSEGCIYSLQIATHPGEGINQGSPDMSLVFMCDWLAHVTLTWESWDWIPPGPLLRSQKHRFSQTPTATHAHISETHTKAVDKT